MISDVACDLWGVFDVGKGRPPEGPRCQTRGMGTLQSGHVRGKALLVAGKRLPVQRGSPK